MSISTEIKLSILNNNIKISEQFLSIPYQCKTLYNTSTAVTNPSVASTNMVAHLGTLQTDNTTIAQLKQL